MLAPNTVQIIGGLSVPVVILGHPAFPLLPWLIKPYSYSGGGGGGHGLGVKAKIAEQRQ